MLYVDFTVKRRSAASVNSTVTGVISPGVYTDHFIVEAFDKDDGYRWAKVSNNKGETWYCATGTVSEPNKWVYDPAYGTTVVTPADDDLRMANLEASVAVVYSKLDAIALAQERHQRAIEALEGLTTADDDNEAQKALVARLQQELADLSYHETNLSHEVDRMSDTLEAAQRGLVYLDEVAEFTKSLYMKILDTKFPE